MCSVLDANKGFSCVLVPAPSILCSGGVTPSRANFIKCLWRRYTVFTPARKDAKRKNHRSMTPVRIVHRAVAPLSSSSAEWFAFTAPCRIQRAVRIMVVD